VSIGIAALETADELASVSEIELLRRADACLYVSKELGRNRATAAASRCSGSVMSDVPAGGKNEVN
jgi:PleD family two-component response regulator